MCRPDKKSVPIINLHYIKRYLIAAFILKMKVFVPDSEGGGTYSAMHAMQLIHVKKPEI